MSNFRSQKVKITADRQVCNRLIWDNRLNSSVFIVGYCDRKIKDSFREKPLLQWASQEDIPWHRMRYIRCYETIVWDRDRRIDLITTGKLPDLAWVKNEDNLEERENIFKTDLSANKTQKKLQLSDSSIVKRELENSKASLSKITPVYRSAIVIIPPEEILPPIQEIRQKCDRNFIRWMPHINLIYGFIPDKYFPEAAKKIAKNLVDFESFTINFAGFNTFKHRRSCTAWLQPDPEPKNALKKLQATLESIFPQCDEQGKKSQAGFTPHLSVGQFKNPDQAINNLPEWHSVTFKLESIYLISRRQEDPFQIRYRIDFGKQEPILINA